MLGDRLKKAIEKLKELSNDPTQPIDPNLLSNIENLLTLTDSSIPTSFTLNSPDRDIIFGGKTQALIQVKSRERVSLKSIWNLDIFYNKIPLLKVFTLLNLILLLAAVIWIKYF